MNSPVPQTFLARHAATLTRVVDDHMFAVDQPGGPPATFRLLWRCHALLSTTQTPEGPITR
ncbi:hypothetical protein [Sphaerisporangium sp. NPDC051011]|uniref:hypothetical protein n=1 Tax=Sphaerisporangium sp. NPDC051011 TaxID=3155792 RepID=UPI0033D842D1